MTETLTDPLAASLSPALEALAKAGPAALTARRRAALEAFLAAPLPDRARHLWRYTDPARLLPVGLVPVTAAPGTGLPACALLRPGLLGGGGTAGAVPDGIEIADLASAGGAMDFLGTLSSPEAGRFEALNLALFSGGAFVRIPRGLRVEAPLSLVHRAGAPGTVSCPRSLVVVEEGAEAALVEEYESEDGADGMIHAVTEVFLAPGARLVHTVVNTLGDRVRASLVQRARLEAGSSLTSVTVTLGGALSKTEASTVLAGPGARSEVLGAVFGAGRQQSDLHILQDHEAPRTGSDLLVRVALRDRARASYTGRLVIAKGAPHCEARQENRNLLLSERARADSIPELEILTHEVLCSHAAATGPVDPAQMFYLRSRGLLEAEAERVIVLGFLEPVFARVPGTELADALRAVALRRLGG